MKGLGAAPVCHEALQEGKSHGNGLLVFDSGQLYPLRIVILHYQDVPESILGTRKRANQVHRDSFAATAHVLLFQLLDTPANARLRLLACQTCPTPVHHIVGHIVPEIVPEQHVIDLFIRKVTDRTLVDLLPQVQPPLKRNKTLYSRFMNGERSLYYYPT